MTSARFVLFAALLAVHSLAGAQSAVPHTAAILSPLEQTVNCCRWTSRSSASFMPRCAVSRAGACGPYKMAPFESNLPKRSRHHFPARRNGCFVPRSTPMVNRWLPYTLLHTRFLRLAHPQMRSSRQDIRWATWPSPMSRGNHVLVFLLAGAHNLVFLA